MVNRYQESIANALGKNPPEIVLKGGRIVDVQSGLITEGDVAIRGHRIVGLYDDYTADSVMDLKGRYVLPGFIEPHIHIESSMLTLTNFSRAVLPHGTTTVISDPHEIANVLGIKGIRQMMDEGHYTNLRCYFTVPSCVPALGMPFETSGAEVTVDDIKLLIMERDCIGLGEVMNFPGVLSGDEKILSKIEETYRMRGYKKLPPIIDGHCPGLSGKALSGYINAGIMADHETSAGGELEEKLKKGMMVMVRNGSTAKDVGLMEYVAERGIDTRRLMFCSDDRTAYDLLTKGHINDTLREAAALTKGAIGAVDLVRMATLTPAEFFGMRYRGRLGIGTRADIAIVDDLESFEVYATFRNGLLVAQEGELKNDCEDYPYHQYMLKTVNIQRPFSAEDFHTHRKNVRAIRVLPGKLITQETQARVEDVLKAAVINRHTGEDNFSIGFVDGFGMKEGAMATTVGHDAHNLCVIGASDTDMAHAVNELRRMQGGVVVAKDSSTVASLRLNVAGLMSKDSPDKVVRDKAKVLKAYASLGGTLEDPVAAMSFLQLAVIPELHLTDRGLVRIGPEGPEKVRL